MNTPHTAAEDKIFSHLRGTALLDPDRPAAVLLSGGVDSAVTLKILQAYGVKKLKAYYLKVWFQDQAKSLGVCPWEDDLDSAAAVCDQLDVPLQILTMEEEYHSRVITYMIEELKRGRTPSPDLLCNRHIKFGAFYSYLSQQDRFAGTLIASGHYSLLLPRRALPASLQAPAARQAEAAGQVQWIRQAPDAVKDQSYFLSRLAPGQLTGLLFPLGVLTKREVRELAQTWKLPNAERRDSQGICFLGQVKFKDFAEHYLGTQPGPILEIETEKKLGEHRGLWFHTIGQRQGLGLGGGPWYVIQKDLARNALYISRDQRHGGEAPHSDSTSRSRFSIGSGNWFFDPGDLTALPLFLKLRHGPKKISCRLYPETPSDAPERTWTVELEQGEPGIAPGQFAVFYYQDICVGSGVILP